MSTPNISSALTAVTSIPERSEATPALWNSRYAEITNNFNTVQTYLGNNRTYNVKDYGARGDGATDDTTAIQAAIDAANTAGGGVVFVPAGSYKITATLTMYSGVTLRGQSQRSSNILTTTNNVHVLTIAGASAVSRIVQVDVEDLKITGPGEASGSTGVGVYVQYGSVGINFRRLWIVAHGSHGIQFDNSYSSTLEDLLLDSNGGDGFHAETNANNITFKRTLSINNTGNGYKIIGGTTTQFLNADAEGNTLAGFDLRYVFCPQLLGCHMEANGVDGTSPNVYLHYRTNTGEPTTAAIIRGCLIQGAGTTVDGVVVDGANGTIIDGNWFNNHTTDHIRTVATNATRTVIGPNVFAGTGTQLTDNAATTQRLDVDQSNLLWRINPGINFTAVSAPGTNPAGSLFRASTLGGHLRYKADDGIQRSVLIGLEGSANLAFGAMSPFSTSDLTIAVSGVTIGDSVAMHSSTSLEGGLIPHAWVYQPDVVGVRLANISASTVTAVTAGYRVRVIKTQL